MPPPSSEHGFILNNIAFILFEGLRGKRLGRAFAEMGYALFRDPDLTIRQPDVSFVSLNRVQKTQAYYEGAPELAVEVVSPNDHAADLDLKVKEYLAAGSHEVWVVYPKTRSVQVYLRASQSRILSDADMITSDLFPGWSARVADFFDLDY